MNTETATPDALADLDAVAEAVAAGKPVDPEVASRVRERSREARQKLLAARGVQDIGIGLIRELRGDLPAA